MYCPVLALKRAGGRRSRLITVGFAVAVLLGLLIALAQAQHQDGVTRNDDCLPPRDSEYAGQFHAAYMAGLINLSDPIHAAFTACDPPPRGRGKSTTHTFGSVVMAKVNGQPVVAPAEVTVRVTLTDPGKTRIFETEMLQLDINAGGIMIRESPTLPSTGETTITRLPRGEFFITSFFDVFTELSLDGGQTWHPSTDAHGNPASGRVVLREPS